VISGFSAGGVLAHNVACHLRRTGSDVDRVVLFDSGHPVLPRVNVFAFLVIRKLLSKIGRMGGLANSWPVQRARQIFGDSGLLTHLSLLSAWRGDRFDGSITVIRGSGTRLISSLFFGPWRRCARRLDYADAQGLHGGLFHKRNVDGVAAIIRRLMVRL
jgi:surfactin synthase thioesterase subunit